MAFTTVLTRTPGELVFTNVWKAIVIASLILGLIGVWLGWQNREAGIRNRQAGIRLTAWAGGDLMGWVNHVQACHSPAPHLPLPSPQCGTGPSDHIGPPPPPPPWDE